MAVIVIVEDNAQSGRLAAKLLSRSGHRVVLTETGEDGLTTIFETAPDLVLIDLGLPDIDGQTVIALLRQQPALAKTRLIAFTAWPEATAHSMAKAYGCHGVILKPIDTRRFVAQVEAFLAPPEPIAQPSAQHAATGSPHDDSADRAAAE
ncbi:MAG: response regulator [Chloroflexi bacterium]|nr:response regulator [Chloroflexota bacterium]